MRSPADLSFEEALSILDAQYRLYETYRRLYELALQERDLWLSSAPSAESRNFAEEHFLVQAYPYYALKFRSVWFSTVKMDRAMHQLRPGWDRFTATDFEWLVRAILFLVQHKLYRLTKASGDGGLDLIHDERIEMGGVAYANARTVAQCKLYRGTVPISAVRDFFGAMAANVAEGYLFTTGTLTRSGIEFVRHANRSPHANRFYIVGKPQIHELLTLCDEIQTEEEKDDLDDADYDLVERLARQGRAILMATVTNEGQHASTL